MSDKRERCKDFNSGEDVLRFQYKVPSHPCANCGTHTVNYDAKYGWYVCQDCDPDTTVENFVADVMAN